MVNLECAKPITICTLMMEAVISKEFGIKRFRTSKACGN
jgi:hypothetical protein